MMLLNLTSPDMQKRLRQHVYVSVGRATAILVTCLCALFLAGNAFGMLQLRSRASQLSSEADRSTLLTRGQLQATVSDTTKRINAQIQALKKVQLQYNPWLPTMRAMSALIPSGVHLTSIQYTSTPYQVVFTGSADTREAYVAFEKALAGSPLVSASNFGLQTKKTNIDFSVTATLKTNP